MRQRTAKQKTFSINHNFLFSPRHYRMFALGSFAFLLAFMASAALTPVSSSSAQVLQYDVDEETGYYIQVTGSDALTVSDIRPTVDGALSSIKDTLNVETNSPFGFRLVLSAESADMYNTLDTNHTANHFSPVPGDIDNPATLALDTWGFALNQSDAVTSAYSANFSPNSAYNPNGTTVNPDVPTTSSTWAAVPTTPTEIAKLETYNHATGGSDLDIYYGLNASTNLLAGTYTNTIIYTAYSEGANLGLPTMQDFTIDQCNAMLENSSTRLLDTRDQKVYRITKYADGNCWMSQNLALDPVDSAGKGITLTTKDSNISMLEIPSGSYTFPDNAVIASGTTASDEVPQVYTASQNVTTVSCSTDPNYYPYCITSDEKYGNLYNWLAITLGVGTTGIDTEGWKVYSSVCPKGWRLPDSGDEVKGNYGAKAPDKSYGRLMYLILGLTSANANGSAGGTYTQQAQQSPLFLPLAGAYSSSSSNGYGAYARYWSRAAFSDAKAYAIAFGGDSFYPQGNFHKKYGFSARCVFEGPIEDNMNMQDITIDMCNNLDESTATADNRKTLIDSRDNKTYRVSKLADGNCWMVQNLALDPVDTDGNNRTLTTNDTNINTTEIPSGTYTFPDDTLIDSGTTSVNTKEQIYNANATKTTTSCGSNAYCDPDNNEPYGNYYNWMSATLGKGATSITTGEVYSSVCPKGWRLPTSGTSSAYGANAPDKSYGKLVYSTLGFTSENATGATGGAYVKAAQQSPLFLPLAGRYDTMSSGGQGISGVYWSRAAQSNTNSYYLGVSADRGNFYPQDSGSNKRFGFSVRCVLGG